MSEAEGTALSSVRLLENTQTSVQTTERTPVTTGAHLQIDEMPMKDSQVRSEARNDGISEGLEPVHRGSGQESQNSQPSRMVWPAKPLDPSHEGIQVVPDDSLEAWHPNLPMVKSMEEKSKSQRRDCLNGLGRGMKVLILIIAALLIAGIIGGAVGGALAGQHFSPVNSSASISSQNPAATPTASLSSGVIPLPTGTHVDIPTGSLGWSFGRTQILSSVNTCITNINSSAWACEPSGENTGLPTNITTTNSRSSGMIQYRIELLTAPLSTPFVYGAQNPYTGLQVFPLIPVQDGGNLSLGSAQYTSITYNKLVILDESSMTSTTGSRKAKRLSENRLILGRKTTSAHAGDRPWFCWFNSTILEIFIYSNQSTATNSPAQSNVTTDSGLPEYLRLLKLRESFPAAATTNSTDSAAPTAYCEQMQILNSFETVPIGNSDAVPIQTDGTNCGCEFSNA